MVIERLLRTVEKGTCDVGSRRRVLASGPAMGTRHRVLLWGPSVGSCCGVPLSGPHGKPRRHGTISGRDADSRRLPTTLRGVVPATAASSTAAAQRVRSSNAPGRCARPHNAIRCASETSLSAQLGSEPTKLVSTTGKLPPGSRPSASPRSGPATASWGGLPCLGAQAPSEAFRGRLGLYPSRGQLGK